MEWRPAQPLFCAPHKLSLVAHLSPYISICHPTNRFNASPIYAERFVYFHSLAYSLLHVWCWYSTIRRIRNWNIPGIDFFVVVDAKQERRKIKRSSFILCNMQKRYIFCCCCWSGSLHSIHIPGNDIASSSLSRFSNGICRRLSPSAELIAILFTQTHRHTALRSMISMMELLSCESNYKQIKYDNHFSYSYFCSSYFACWW